MYDHADPDEPPDGRNPTGTSCASSSMPAAGRLPQASSEPMAPAPLTPGTSRWLSRPASCHRSAPACAPAAPVSTPASAGPALPRFGRTSAAPRGRRRLVPLLQDPDREHCVTLKLDVKHRVVATTTVSVGSVDHTFIGLREVFRGLPISVVVRAASSSRRASRVAAVDASTSESLCERPVRPVVPPTGPRPRQPLGHSRLVGSSWCAMTSPVAGLMVSITLALLTADTPRCRRSGGGGSHRISP